MKAIITALGFALLISGCAGSFEKYFDQQQQSGYSEQDYYADDGYVVQEEIVQEPAVTYTPTEEEWQWERVNCAYAPIAEDANIDTQGCGNPYGVTIRARNLKVAYYRYLAYDRQSEYPLYHRLVKKLPQNDYTYNYKPSALDDDWFGTKYEYKGAKQLFITIQDEDCRHQQDYLKFYDLGNGKVRIISAQDPC